MAYKSISLCGAVAMGFFTMAITSVSFSAQAVILSNGGFVPTNVAPFKSSGINSTSGVTIGNWTVTDNPNNVSGYVNNLMYVVSDGNTFSKEGGVGMNDKGLNGRKSWTLFGDNGQQVNSVDGSGWYIASDGDPQYSGSISQILTGLTAGAEYNVSFSQAAGQFNCNFGTLANPSSSCNEGGTYSGATTDLWKVSFGSSTLNSALMNLASQGSVTPWQSQTLKFTASASTQVLSFLAFGTPAAQPPTALLSGVSVELVPPKDPPTGVPEPSTALGIVVASGLFAGLRRSKLKKSKQYF